VGTRYEHYGRSDHEGFPVQPPTTTKFSRHFCHTEVLLHQTQDQMDRARTITDERGLELAVLREDLQEFIFSCHRLIVTERKVEKKNKILRKQLRDL
jgi:hypothetical protein